MEGGECGKVFDKRVKIECGSSDRSCQKAERCVLFRQNVGMNDRRFAEATNLHNILNKQFYDELSTVSTDLSTAVYF